MKSETDVQQRLEAACALAEASLEGAFGERRTNWMNRLEAEHDNFASLLQDLLEQGAAEPGLRLTSLLQELWFEAKYTAEGFDWLKRFLGLPAAQARTGLRASGLDLAGAYALNLGNYEEARRLKEEALGIFRECGKPVEIAYTLFHLGHLSGFVQGDYAAAREFYEQGLDLLREACYKEGITHGMANLGTAFAGLGAAAQAAPLIAESLRCYRERGSVYNLGLSLRRAAIVAAGLGQAEAALRLAAASDRQRSALGVSEPEVFSQAYACLLEPARRQLDEQSQSRLWAEGTMLSLDQAVDVALQVLSCPSIQAG
ncbi:MAG TPA: tetratricopeptide repeat protein [Anaerolineales bacterium]|nr:tetratricopeptide repeat protein [Anaerolineales bacterium]